MARRFVVLDPKNAKRAAIEKCLSPLGVLDWWRVVPLSGRSTFEARARAEAALRTATKIPSLRSLRTAKTQLLAWQYNGARRYFDRHPECVAVAWNALNGTRRVFLEAARDAGCQVLAFELCPFPGRITVDPKGVNFNNSLPRVSGAYLDWAKENGARGAWRDMADQITARRGKRPAPDPTAGLDQPFLFLPLQVPGDSQLRLFGGAYRTVEAVIAHVTKAAKALPDGWHLRVKEHPSSPIQFTDQVRGTDRVVLDNGTDTFVQVRASRGVVTVNSSVGLEAMFYDKPVIALGQCFWAIPNVARHCPDPADLPRLLSNPSAWSFDPGIRTAFLDFLVSEYYPRLDDPKGTADKVSRRLAGPDKFGFWSS